MSGPAAVMMEVNLRRDRYFVEDEAWERACAGYTGFIRQNRNRRMVFLELGVGMNTPGIIKYPFWQLTDRENMAFISASIRERPGGPEEIREKSLYVNMDIAEALEAVREVM